MNFWNYSGLDFRSKIGNMAQVAGIQHYEFLDGKAKGVEAFGLRTGSGLEFTVLPGRGMDIAAMEYRGVPLAYQSKTGIVSPAYYESEGMGWIRSFFAGMMTTCGLMNVGGPSKQPHPVIGDRTYGLHGRISNCAADQISCYEDWHAGTYVMRISGRMKEAVLHGESLSLRREIETAFGQSDFTIRDTVTNDSQYEQPFMIMYHINAGFPLLDESSLFYCLSDRVTPLSKEAEDKRSTIDQCQPPRLGQKELCYAHDLRENRHGVIRMAIVNPDLQLGLGLIYKKEDLPCFTQWKMFNEREYVLGLEPGNCLPMGIEDAKKTQKFGLLRPLESKTIELTFAVLDGTEEIDSWIKQIHQPLQDFSGEKEGLR
ncbi:MAG: aldose 1-epimerase family protein [Clostridiaceae bacterium]|nr:aldose 1-epimerase family protein [Clostridiaceae bacterium]